MLRYPNTAPMLRGRTHPLLTLTMLSPSSPSTSATCESRLPSFLGSSSPNPKTSLPHLPPPVFSNSQNSPQRMILSRCCSEVSSPVPISGIPEMENSEPEFDDPQSLVVVSFYKFADFPDHAHLRKLLKELCEALDFKPIRVPHQPDPIQRVSGGVILAAEGINGSICGTRESVEKVLSFIQSDNRLKGLRQVESPVSPEEEAIHHGHSASSPLAAGEDAPFRWDHVRVKLKKEIVTLGMPTVSPIERVGKYVGPRDWNALISDPDTVVIDVRNDYETRIGKFKGAVDPCTTSFREFPSWVEDHFQLNSAEKETENPEQEMPRVAMYCTGGIRCEKATSLLLRKGFREVFHLEGGILKYLEEVPKTESLWQGECFVFDKRVSVDHGLVQGNFKLCYGCKQPVSDADVEAPEFEYGVSCPHCFAQKSEEEKERARARQRQFKRWGIIGGPDKGRRPTSEPNGSSRKPNQLSRSL